MFLQTDQILSTGPINASAVGPNLILAKQSNSRIIVYKFALICTAVVGIKWKFDATELGPYMIFQLGGAWDTGTIGGYPLFSLDEKDLNLDLDTAVSVTGLIWYRRVGLGIGA